MSLISLSPKAERALPRTPAGVGLTATPALQECAQHLSRLRSQGHDHTRTRCQDLGLRNRECDYFGLLAELVLYDALERQGYRPTYTLLADRPPCGPDMELGIAYEIKACLPGKMFLCINADAHQRRAGAAYLPILFTSPATLRVMAPVLHGEVSRWKRMTNGHSPYYSCHRDALEPLACLDDLMPFEEAGDPFAGA